MAVMGSSRLQLGATAAVLVLTLLALGTFSVSHACRAAHAGDHQPSNCAICHAVGSSLATLTKPTLLCAPDGTPQPLDLRPLGAFEGTFATSTRSRGPPPFRA
jgi:hypothetical protein